MLEVVIGILGALWLSTWAVDYLRPGLLVARDGLSKWAWFRKAWRAKATATDVEEWDGARFRRESQKRRGLVVLDGGVFNLDQWKHPGGDFLHLLEGIDATPWVVSVHAKHETVLRFLQGRLVARLTEPIASEEDQRFLRLHEQYRADGIFDFDWMWFWREVLLILLHWAVGAWLYYEQGWSVVGAGVVIWGSTRCGFLSHDVGHHEVFADAKNAGRFSSWCGILLWGLDFYAATNVHAIHHSFTNVVGYDTALEMGPVKWHPAQGGRHLGRLQNVLFYGLLIWLVYPAYVVSSVAEAVRKRDVAKGLVLSVRLLLWGVVYWAVLPWTLSVPVGLAYFGALASLNHFHNEITEAEEYLSKGRCSWVRSQANTITNYYPARPSWLFDWATGHLNYHIEHHLFPMIPRHRLPDIRDDVLALCRDAGAQYDHQPISTVLYSFNQKLSSPF